jgi:hypothetical protein
MADKAFRNSGLYCDAQLAWDKAHRQMGNKDKTLNNKGQRVFLTQSNIEHDLKVINMQIKALDETMTSGKAPIGADITLKYLRDKEKALQDLNHGLSISINGKEIFEILDDQYKAEVAALQNKIEAEKKKKEFEEKAKKDAVITGKNAAIVSEEIGKKQVWAGINGGYNGGMPY